MDYEPYAKGDRILFSASDRHAGSDGLLEQKLYTVTTGRDGKPPGKIELVLDAKNYQNFSFDLSSDGSTILVQRLKKGKRGKVGLWMIKQGKKAKPLEAEPGGEFLITPDSNAIAIAQGQGLAILPLEANAEPLEFLPKFAQVLDFSRNGAAAAMVKFNTDYTRSLFLVTNTGVQKELRRIKGSILDAEFSPDGKILYTLLTTLIEGEEYREEPYIAAINLETEEATTLVLLPKHREIQMSLSPDGLGLLFDQISTINRGRSQGSEAMPRTDSGEAIVASRLWLLPLDPSIPPEEMEDLTPVDFPFPGLRPEWLP
jgi:dipeptidyl aminopeptidase/acylaminoacyl peptidase